MKIVLFNEGKLPLDRITLAEIRFGREIEKDEKTAAVDEAINSIARRLADTPMNKGNILGRIGIGTWEKKSPLRDEIKRLEEIKSDIETIYALPDNQSPSFSDEDEEIKQKAHTRLRNFIDTAEKRLKKNTPKNRAFLRSCLRELNEIISPPEEHLDSSALWFDYTSLPNDATSSKLSEIVELEYIEKFFNPSQKNQKAFEDKFGQKISQETDKDVLFEYACSLQEQQYSITDKATQRAVISLLYSSLYGLYHSSSMFFLSDFLGYDVSSEQALQKKLKDFLHLNNFRVHLKNSNNGITMTVTASLICCKKNKRSRSNSPPSMSANSDIKRVAELNKEDISAEQEPLGDINFIVSINGYNAQMIESNLELRPNNQNRSRVMAFLQEHHQKLKSLSYTYASEDEKALFKIASYLDSDNLDNLIAETKKNSQEPALLQEQIDLFVKLTKKNRSLASITSIINTYSTLDDNNVNTLNLHKEHYEENIALICFKKRTEELGSEREAAIEHELFLAERLFYSELMSSYSNSQNTDLKMPSFEIIEALLEGREKALNEAKSDGSIDENDSIDKLFLHFKALETEFNKLYDKHTKGSFTVCPAYHIETLFKDFFKSQLSGETSIRNEESALEQAKIQCEIAFFNSVASSNISFSSLYNFLAKKAKSNVTVKKIYDQLCKMRVTEISLNAPFLEEKFKRKLEEYNKGLLYVLTQASLDNTKAEINTHISSAQVRLYAYALEHNYLEFIEFSTGKRLFEDNSHIRLFLRYVDNDAYWESIKDLADELTQNRSQEELSLINEELESLKKKIRNEIFNCIQQRPSEAELETSTPLAINEIIENGKEELRQLASISQPSDSFESLINDPINTWGELWAKTWNYVAEKSSTDTEPKTSPKTLFNIIALPFKAIYWLLNVLHQTLQFFTEMPLLFASLAFKKGADYYGKKAKSHNLSNRMMAGFLFFCYRLFELLFLLARAVVSPERSFKEAYKKGAIYAILSIATTLITWTLITGPLSLLVATGAALPVISTALGPIAKAFFTTASTISFLKILPLQTVNRFLYVATAGVIIALVSKISSWFYGNPSPTKSRGSDNASTDRNRSISDAEDTNLLGDSSDNSGEKQFSIGTGTYQTVMTKTPSTESFIASNSNRKLSGTDPDEAFDLADNGVIFVEPERNSKVSSIGNFYGYLFSSSTGNSSLPKDASTSAPTNEFGLSLPGYGEKK